MEWISGIGRSSDGRLCVQAQLQDGMRTQIELDKIRTDFGLGQSSRRKMVFALHELRRGSTRAYLDGLGLAALDAEVQSVYEATVGSETLVIPAQLLVLALFGSTAPLRRLLWSPLGAGHQTTAIRTADNDGVELLFAPNSAAVWPHANDDATHRRLAWVLTHSSAKAAWGSVYRNALDGRFDMAMPRAIAHVSVWARPAAGKLLATSLTVQMIVPAEDSEQLEYRKAPCEFVFDDRMNTQSIGRPQVHDQRLSVADFAKPMSDEKWSLIEPLLRDARRQGPGAQRGVPAAQKMRDIVDVLRLKLGTPLPWVQVPRDKKLVSAAANAWVWMQRDGLWDRVVATLA